MTRGRWGVSVVHQAEREDAMKQVIVSRNNNEEVLVQTPTGKILAECFFKAEDETPDELRQMGYRSLTEQYRRAHIIVGAGLEAADLAELFVES
jgi:hypothetical protein